MLIYPYLKGKNVSYSIKSQNVMKNFIFNILCLKKSLNYQYTLHFVNYENFGSMFPNKDRTPIIDFDKYPKHIVIDYRLLYSIITETNLSFISNHSRFYDHNDEYYFKNGILYLTPLSFTETYKDFHNKLEYNPILVKPLVIKLGLFGTYLDKRYPRKRTIKYK